MRSSDIAGNKTIENDSQKQKHIDRRVGEHSGLQNRFIGAAFGEGRGQRKSHHDRCRQDFHHAPNTRHFV